MRRAGTTGVLPVLLVVAVAAGVGLSACGGGGGGGGEQKNKAPATPQLDTAKVESQLKASLSSASLPSLSELQRAQAEGRPARPGRTKVKSASCPGSVVQRQGEVFACQVTTVD